MHDDNQHLSIIFDQYSMDGDICDPFSNENALLRFQ